MLPTHRQKSHRHSLGILILLPTLLCITLSVHAEPAKPGELEAAYIYNFTKFTSWPQSHDNGKNSIELCILGEDDIADNLRSLAGKKAQDRLISITTTVTEESLGRCHALYMSPAQRKRYEYIINRLANRPVLTIGNDGRFLDAGGIINLTQQGDRLRFEINLGALQKSKITISSKLLALAILSNRRYRAW